jgi:phenazine biosynthesis protein phzE
VDAVVVGPGPGDPRDRTDPRIATLTALTRGLLERRVPIFAVCLGHQLLATQVGLPVRRAPVPTQGTQREITFDGQARRVAFYTPFAAFCPHDEITCAITGDTVRVLREPATGEVFGLRRPGMASVQFHVESVLTKDGPQLLGGMLRSLLGEPAAPGRGDDPGILALTPTA